MSIIIDIRTSLVPLEDEILPDQLRLLHYRGRTVGVLRLDGSARSEDMGVNIDGQLRSDGFYVRVGVILSPEGVEQLRAAARDSIVRFMETLKIVIEDAR